LEKQTNGQKEPRRPLGRNKSSKFGWHLRSVCPSGRQWTAAWPERRAIARNGKIQFADAREPAMCRRHEPGVARSG